MKTIKHIVKVSKGDEIRLFYISANCPDGQISIRMSANSFIRGGVDE
ncbi:MAG: hypothetical protein HY769_00410 [Candidatus Stahlbacteria bacterium]|nr:hypothetical protein [Candidatus Stahlbacteria bacterium]